VAYAALIAVAKDALRRDLRCVELRTADREIALDLEQHRAVPQALMLPYVVLRCALNRFREARVIAVEDEAVRDLTARARAEVFLGVAA
jgi:energy-converting hydrogenase Eha subunit G